MKRIILFSVLAVLLAGVVMMTVPALAAQKIFTNSLGMEFVYIPAGSFYMGSCKMDESMEAENRKRAFMGQAPLSAPCPSGAALDKDASDNEMPQHKVTISKGFYIGKFEVTLGQFKQYIAATGTELLSDYFIRVNSYGDNYPVTGVSWDDAQAFIRWLNGKEKGRTYRLPTEAQWEYACRAGTTTRFNTGDCLSTDQANYDGKPLEGCPKGQYRERPVPVGSFPPNAWGLYDMHGNVWEWCQDWYGDYKAGAVTDPAGPSSGSIRVFRGGCWDFNARFCRSADRYGGYPGARYNNLGFRLVCLQAGK